MIDKLKQESIEIAILLYNLSKENYNKSEKSIEKLSLRSEKLIEESLLLCNLNTITQVKAIAREDKVLQQIINLKKL